MWRDNKVIGKQKQKLNRKSVSLKVNKYLQDVSINYLQTPNLLVVESLTEHNARQDRLFRILINSKFTKKITLTGKIKNKLFENFKSKALANACIYVIIQKEKTVEQLVKDIKALNQETDLRIKSLIYNWTMVDFNSENLDLFYELIYLKSKLIYISLLLIIRRIVIFFDVINNQYNLLNKIIYNKS